MVTTRQLTIDTSLIELVGDSPTGSERGDMDAVDAIHRAALAYGRTPVDALRLIVHAVIDLAEQASNAPDVLTAAIAMLCEWRDGRSPIDPLGLPVPDLTLTLDEVISRADEPTEPSTVGRRR